MSSNEAFDTDIVDISEFFSGGDVSSDIDDIEAKSTVNEVDSPIKELKAIILSLDWEITDEIADSFILEVDHLQEVWKSDKTVIAFLHILRALGKYLRTHKADAHPESVHLLYSVYNTFEKLVLTDEISEDQEQVLLQEQLDKFKALKEKIALAAAAASEGKANEHLLSGLKTILLEIDWQITDQTMQKFDIEINKLEQIWSADKNFLTPLQMMRAIGSYINKHKRDSHPDSVKLLSTVFNHFEEMALTDDMTVEEQQSLIQKDLETFTRLKEEILTAKTSAPGSIAVTADAITDDIIVSESTSTAPPAQAFDDANDDEELGYVEPIHFDADDTVPCQTDLEGVVDLASDDTTGDEVDARLNALFSDQETMSITPEPAPTPTVEPEEEVAARLGTLFDTNDEGLPSETTELPTIPEAESVEETAPDESLPPGQLFEIEDAEIPAATGQQPLASTAEGPQMRQQKSALPVDLLNNLESLLGAAPHPEKIDTGLLNEHLNTLLNHCKPNVMAAAAIQILLSIARYIEISKTQAHDDALTILRSACQALQQSAQEGHSSDASSALCSLIHEYTTFQNSRILPVLAHLSRNEETIKKILGLSS